MNLASPVETPQATRNVVVKKISSEPNVRPTIKGSPVREKSIISEVDPAFEEGYGMTPKKGDPEYFRGSNKMIATFQNKDDEYLQAP